MNSQAPHTGAIFIPTVFVVDDDQECGKLLQALFSTVQLPVELYSSAKDFLSSIKSDRPGCLVLDVCMPEMNGLDLLETLSSRGNCLPTIILTGNYFVPTAIRAVRAGAVDVVEKPFRQYDLLERVRAALELDVRQRRSNQPRLFCVERFQSLTPRECEVMHLLVNGKSGKQIASELNISYKTMEKFRGRVMHKMEAGSVAELVQMAFRLNIVNVDH